MAGYNIFISHDLAPLTERNSVAAAAGSIDPRDHVSASCDTVHVTSPVAALTPTPRPCPNMGAS